MRNFDRKINFINELNKEKEYELDNNILLNILLEKKLELKLVEFNYDTFGKTVYAVINRKKEEGFDKQFLNLNGFQIAKETLQKYITKFHFKDLTNFTMYVKKAELDLFEEFNDKNNYIDIINENYNYILKNFINFLSSEFITEIEEIYYNTLNKIFINDNQITGKKIILKPKTSEIKVGAKKIPFSIKVLKRKEFVLRERLTSLELIDNIINKVKEKRKFY